MQLAGNAGFRHELLPWLQVQAAAGKSLREGNLGGPRLRIYAGFKVGFAALPKAARERREK